MFKATEMQTCVGRLLTAAVVRLHCVIQLPFWAAWYSTRLLVNLTPKGVVFSFLFYSFHKAVHKCAGLSQCTIHVEGVVSTAP